MSNPCQCFCGFFHKVPRPGTKNAPAQSRGARLSKKSRPADMCGWTGHIQGNGALRVCEPLCGECAVQRSILSPGGSCAKRVQWTKQRRRGWRSAPVFASAHRGAPQKSAKRKRARGKEFLSCACRQKWVPPGAWRFCDTLMPLPKAGAQGPVRPGIRSRGRASAWPRTARPAGRSALPPRRAARPGRCPCP